MVGSSDRSPCLCTQEKDYTQVYTRLDKHTFQHTFVIIFLAFITYVFGTQVHIHL